jgi:hypothetical protein
LAKPSGYVESYLAELTKAYHAPKIPIKTLKAERTFWEKVTILHSEHHRTRDKQNPLRITRHYYDVYKLASHLVGSNAIRDEALLEDVVRNKSLCFASNWSSYETARVGQLKLSPLPHQISLLQDDYKKTQDMFFGEFPSFTQLIESINMLETQINSYSRIITELQKTGEITTNEASKLNYNIEHIIITFPKKVQNKTDLVEDKWALAPHTNYPDIKKRCLYNFNEALKEAYFDTLNDLYAKLIKVQLEAKTLQSLFLAVDNVLYKKLEEHWGIILHDPMIAENFKISRQDKIDEILNINK